MHKFFVPSININDVSATIEGEDVKHIYKVLRLKIGDNININNCNGKEFLGEITNISKKDVNVKIIKEIFDYNESKINIHLFQGLPKSSKMDLIVQKNTEIGVKEITPIITNRVVVKADLKEFKKIDRWQRIILEASKQSKRSIIPSINKPIYFDELIEKLASMDLILVPYENEENKGIKSAINEVKNTDIKNVGIIIGPEGGFEQDEIIKLKEIGAHIVTLGPRILRTETAGFVSSTIVMYELGDMGGN